MTALCHGVGFHDERKYIPTDNITRCTRVNISSHICTHGHLNIYVDVRQNYVKVRVR